MSKSKKSDHWLDLAQEIGAAIDRDLFEETAEPEGQAEREAVEEAAEEAAEEVVERGIEQQPLPAHEVESRADVQPPSDVELQSDTVETSDTPAAEETAQSGVDEAEKVKPAKPAGFGGHWFDLASSLGLDVPPPEQEPELVEASADQDVEVLPAFTPAVTPQEESLSKTPKRDDQDEPPVLESVEQPVAEGTAPIERETVKKPADGPLSLFEDPDLRLDTPGVLDAVFDGDDAVIARALGGQPSRRDRAVPAKVEVEEEAETTSEFAREVADFAAEAHVKDPEVVVPGDVVPGDVVPGDVVPGDVVPGDVVPGDVDEPDEADEAGESDDSGTSGESETGESETGESETGESETGESETGEDQKRGRRRKRRRRRKPARKDQDAAGEDVQEAKESTSDAESSDVEEARDVKVAASTPRDQDGPARRRQSAPEEDVDEESGEKAKHKKIPTWQEAITVLVTTNLETRSKNPNAGGGPRGRGRRGRR